MTKKEFELLVLFAKYPNKVFTRDNYWMQSGAMTITATVVPLTAISNVCEQN